MAVFISCRCVARSFPRHSSTSGTLHILEGRFFPLDWQHHLLRCCHDIKISYGWILCIHLPLLDTSLSEKLGYESRLSRKISLGRERRKCYLAYRGSSLGGPWLSRMSMKPLGSLWRAVALRSPYSRFLLGWRARPVCRTSVMGQWVLVSTTVLFTYYPYCSTIGYLPIIWTHEASVTEFL
jgi:hypothetical protein